MALLVIVSLVIITASMLLYLTRRKYNYWKAKSVPYSTPTPFLGTFGSYIRQQKALGEAVSDVCKKFPEEPLVGGFLGTDPVLIVQDPELVKLVTTKDSYYFSGRVKSGDDQWRVIMQPLAKLFSDESMRNMFYLIQNCVQDLDKLLDDETKIVEVLEVKCLVARFVMDCFGSCFFGTETKTLENSYHNPFRTLIDQMLEVKKATALSSVFSTIFQKYVQPSEKDTILKKHLSGVFQQRRQNTLTRPDFISLLLEFQKKNNAIESKSEHPSKPGKANICLEIKDDSLISQSIAFFAAGFETTTTIFTLTLYELSKNPDAQNKALAEIDANYKETMDYDCVTNLTFLEQCISETLRLHPMLTVISREVFENYTLPNRIRLDRGLKVFVPVLHLHHHPKYFQDPEKFWPERFSKDGRESIVPYTFIPFGEGPASCLGQKFAKQLILSGLVGMLSRHQLSPAEDTPATLTLHAASATLSQVRETIRLKLTRRGRMDVI